MGLTERAVRKAVREAHRFPGTPDIAPYNLSVSAEHRFVWFRVAKVGTRSILNLLDGVHLVEERRARYLYPWGRYRDYYKFAFVRHPRDRFLSAWRNKVVEHNHFRFDEEVQANLSRSPWMFAEWVAAQPRATRDEHIRPMVDLVDVDNLDFLGRMETFHQDIRTVFATFGLSPDIVPRKNASDAAKYPELDAVGESLARSMFVDDLAAFGYTWPIDER